MRSSLLSIGVVVVSGALLRLWSLRDGSVTAAEAHLIDDVVRVLRTGTYQPASLNHPTLPLYLHVFVSVVHVLWGGLIGAWHSLSQFGPEQVVGWSRAASALLGTSVVFIVYQIGMRWGSRHALLAAGLMAVSPTHVAASREIGDGSPLTFFAALTLLLSIGAIERVNRKAYVMAGAAAGLAAASHYAGFVALALPLVAAWMTPRDDSSRISRAAAATLATLAAFIAATPASITSLPAFLNGFASAAYPPGGPITNRIDLLGQLLWAMQWPGLLLLVAGLTLGVIRAIQGPGHTRWALLVSFPVIFFVLVAWHGATSEAILLPLLPAVSVIAAIAVISGVSLLRRFDIPRAARTALIAALTVIAILPGAVFSIDLVRLAGRQGAQSTRR